MINRRFVYVTLAPGRLNSHVLDGVPGSWEPASVTGTLLPEGWGAAAGFLQLSPALTSQASLSL